MNLRFSLTILLLSPPPPFFPIRCACTWSSRGSHELVGRLSYAIVTDCPRFVVNIQGSSWVVFFGRGSFVVVIVLEGHRFLLQYPPHFKFLTSIFKVDGLFTLACYGGINNSNHNV